MKNLSKSHIIIVLVAAVALLGGVLAGFFVLPLLSPSGGAATAYGAPARPSPDVSHAKETTPEPGLMYQMKERVVTLGDTGGLHYLKVEVVLEFDVPDAKGLKGEAYKKRQEEFVKDMASRRPIMDDMITSILAGKTSISLANVEGKDKLREELKVKLGEVVGEHKLLNVYLTQFIIQ